jgi:hypothetical protein
MDSAPAAEASRMQRLMLSYTSLGLPATMPMSGKHKRCSTGRGAQAGFRVRDRRRSQLKPQQQSVNGRHEPIADAQTLVRATDREPPQADGA